MQSLGERIDAAREMVNFVRDRMIYGSSDDYRLARVGKLKRARECVYAVTSGYSSWPIEMPEHFVRAQRALALGCGNCGHQSSVAFLTLAWLNFLPVDHFNTDGHAFVILGRTDTSPVMTSPPTDAAAVLCDPWMNSWGPASAMRTDGYFLPATRTARVDAGGLTEPLRRKVEQILLGAKGNAGYASGDPP